MIVDVAVPVGVDQTFHYAISDDLKNELQLGTVIQVPFRTRSIHAFVLGFPTESPVGIEKLRPIEGVLVPQPIFDERMLKFFRWLSEYYCHPLGEVITAAIPAQYWKPKKTSKRKRKALDPALLTGLAPPQTERPTLNEEQRLAVNSILGENEGRPVLLHGVTGSGKTEVYMNVLDALLQQGKGAIVLVPEIALTPQLLGRFSQRFPEQVAVLHSHLSAAERFEQWERLRAGKAKVVVGARSAVFAPVKDLGLIVIDEEHEASFKQEDHMRYHARDTAIVRARFENAKVVLGSATPSLESYANAKNGRYVYVALKKRVHQRAMPKTVFVDLKDAAQCVSAEVPWLSRVLKSRIENTLQENQQCLLYLNRLGFAHFLFCKDCGHTWRCTNCDVALTYYRVPPSLKCHYCGKISRAPENCEECSGTHLETIGVGTEQVEKSLKELFPSARIARMDRSVVKTRKDLEAVLNQIAQREVDIVVGTQMIAKGHDFPGIALVGILLADSSLNLPDFRAHEKTFQIITQVSGRAGRAEAAGEIVIQTVNPDHPVLRAAAEHRDEDFYRLELEGRSLYGFPPYHRLAMLRFQHKNPRTVEAFASDLVSQTQNWIARHDLRCPVLGPSEAPLSRLKNYYRWQCLVKSQSVRNLHLVLKFVHEYAQSQKSSVQLFVDIDPISSL